ncbi:UNVERIFIED_CONTAM: hypothetical protein Cloal_0715 [Acetivibrio alkalicellulosi]
MINISLKDGLIYVDATLIHGISSIKIKNTLVDTGSSATVISRDIAHSLGIGGSESVVEKKIDYPPSRKPTFVFLNLPYLNIFRKCVALGLQPQVIFQNLFVFY